MTNDYKQIFTKLHNDIQLRQAYFRSLCDKLDAIHNGITSEMNQSLFPHGRKYAVKQLDKLIDM